LPTEKFSAEKAIQERRQRSFDMEEAQRRASDFYAKGLVTTLQDAKWGSDATFEKSMRSYQSQHDRLEAETVRQQRLDTRRGKLAELIASERDDFTRELTARVPTKEERLETMRSKADEIKTGRDTRRASSADASRRMLIRSE
jgi:hypothetical protein